MSLSSLVPPRPVRVSDDCLETVRWTLRNRSAGRVVTLVGMVHVGSDAYYRTTSEVVSSLASGGAVVHYELVSRVGDDVVATLSQSERSDLLAFRDLMSRSAASVLADLLGLSLQKVHLAYPEGALNVDFTDLDLLRRLGLERAAKLFDLEALETTSAKKVRRVLRFVMSHYRPISLVAKLVPATRATAQVILHERNALALAAARDALEDSDLVLVWGAAHLPEMRAELERWGYVLTGEVWEPAADLG